MQENFNSGFVALIGCPNVGKSTLMNALVGEKVAITTPRAQTTRNKITGILTEGSTQIVFLDTPGIHSPKNKLGQYMMRESEEARRDVDVVVLVVDAEAGLMTRDEQTAEMLEGFYAVVNKTDVVPIQKAEWMAARLKELGAEKVFMLSALTGNGVDELKQALCEAMPEGPMYYPEDMYTDRSEQFIAAEMIREKALFLLREEIPHGVGVEIEKIEEFDNIVNVRALIYCEKDSHKGIIIGKRGEMLKKIGSTARRDLEMLFGSSIYLELFVKIRKDWRNSLLALKELGYK